MANGTGPGRRHRSPGRLRRRDGLRHPQARREQGSVANLDATGIAVYKNVAKDKHWTIGSQVPVVFTKTGRQLMHVAVIYGDKARVGNSSYLLGNTAWAANFTSTLDNRVLIKARSGVSTSAATAAVKTVTRDYPGVTVLDQAGTRPAR